MRKAILIGAALVLTTLAAAAFTLKMPPPPKIALAGATPYPLTAGLFAPKEVAEFTHVVKTSPFDKMVYPIGAQVVGLFETNLPTVFKSVVKAEAAKPTPGVDLVIEPSIVKFEAVVPHPAYNPYTASVILRVNVYDREGNKIFTQTATGNGQSGKGMASGFKARTLAAEAAQAAMVDAAKQILESLLSAPEIKEYK